MTRADELFIDRLRGLSIIRVVLAHLGLSWFFVPWSEYVTVFLPVLFFLSGVVTYFSFRRAASSAPFLCRRLLMLTLPFYLIGVGAAIGFTLGVPSPAVFSLSNFLDWVLLNPSHSDMPFPLGQVWFLRALAVITILSIPVFLLARRNHHLLLLPVAASIGLATVELFYPLYPVFIQFGFNFYQPLACMGFFFLGAWYFAQRRLGRQPPALPLFGGSLLITIALLWLVPHVEVGMTDHTYAPDSYYLAASLAAIFLAMSVEKPLTWMLNRLPPLDRFILFFSKHAFSVFLLHSLMIHLTEVLLGLEGVIDHPPQAALKVVLVFAASMALSVPFTALCRFFRDKIIQAFSSGAALTSDQLPSSAPSEKRSD